MRKYILLLVLFITGSLGFSMEVVLVNRCAPDNVRLYFNSYSFFFKNILFHFNGTYLWHVSGNTFIPVLEKDEVEKNTGKYDMITFEFSDDYKKLFYFFQDQVDRFLGYEIIVEEGEVSLLERSKEYIYSIISESLDFDYSLLNNYKVISTRTTYQNHPYLYYEIRDNNNELGYTLSGIFEPDGLYISRCSVNEKKNKLVLTLCPKTNLLQRFLEEAFFLDECRIIYDSYITDTRVRIRSEPNLRGEVLGYGDKNEAVKILDRSDEKERIDGLEDYWYQVKKADDLTGWMYGAYLSKDFR